MEASSCEGLLAAFRGSLTRASLHPGQPVLIHGGGTSTARTATGYGGHELGHTFGRFHPGSGCGESSDDPNYQYIFGQLANYDAGCVGFDVGDAALGIAMAAYPGTAWHDVMMYCNNQWLSDYTYNRIRNRLADEDDLPAAGPVLLHLPIEEVVASGRPDERVPEIPAMEAKRRRAHADSRRRHRQPDQATRKDRVCQPALGRRCVWAQAREPGADSGIER